MKNTRTQRLGAKVKYEDSKSYWIGGHKYWKDFQLKTSYGNYK